MSTAQILSYTRNWAYEHDYAARDVYPIIRRGSVVLFFVHGRGFQQP